LRSKAPLQSFSIIGEMRQMNPIRPRRFALFLVLFLAQFCAACHNSAVHAADSDIPTARAQQSDLQLKVSATGTLRTITTKPITAPPIAGGTLQIIQLPRTGTFVHVGDVVLEFDPSQQEYNLAQNRSDLLQAEQEIVKAKADVLVQTAEDQTALLKARYARRRAELEVSKNELVSTIDAQKNNLTLDESKRALAQLEIDIKSRSASNQAALRLSEEKRNKATLAMQQAEQNIRNMKITSPIDGLLVIHPNADTISGFFFDGMTLPDYHVGDQANPGSAVAEVIDPAHLEISTQIDETQHANFKPGHSVEARIEAIPGESFKGQIQTVAGSSAAGFFDDDQLHKFEVLVRIESTDTRLRPGFAAKLILLGNKMPNAITIPAGAIFDRNGKKIVYRKHGGSFEAQDVKILAFTEGRVVVEGLPTGTEVALVNPEIQPGAKDKNGNGTNPGFGVSAN